MSEEKDRFGDKLRDAEKAREDEYFGKRDRTLIAKLRSGEQPSLKPPAELHCPKCGTQLHASTRLAVAIDECPSCQGIWVERAALEQLAGRDGQGWLSRYLGRRR